MRQEGVASCSEEPASACRGKRSAASGRAASPLRKSTAPPPRKASPPRKSKPASRPKAAALPKAVSPERTSERTSERTTRHKGAKLSERTSERTAEPTIDRVSSTAVPVNGSLPAYMLEDVAIPTANQSLGPSSYGKGFYQRAEAYAALRQLQEEKRKLGPCPCHYGFCNIWKAAHAGLEDAKSEQDVQIDEFMVLIHIQDTIPGYLHTSKDTFTERGFPTVNAARNWVSRWKRTNVDQDDYRATYWKLLVSEASERGC